MRNSTDQWQDFSVFWWLNLRFKLFQKKFHSSYPFNWLFIQLFAASKMSFQFVCLVLILLSHRLLGEEIEFLGGDPSDKSSRKKDKTLKYQRIAVDSWARELTPDDYDREKWPSITGHRQPQHVFDFYAQKLSDSFAANKAKVNFFLVGACDGTHDKTIRDRFLPNENWNGIFVEPITMNFKDLNKFIADNKVESRSITIQAAVTDVCKTPTVPMKVCDNCIHIHLSLLHIIIYI